MSGSATNDADRTERQHATPSLVARARDSLARLGPTRRGTIAMLAGGALIARAKSTRGTLRTAISALAGLGLVAYGVRQRLSGGRGGGDGSGGSGPRDRPDDRTGATDEGTGATESMRQESHTGTNPRDVDDEPDVETETDQDEGRVQFTTDHDEPGATAPDLEEGGERDSRLDDETDDESVDVDISEAAMADEPNEAAGPTSEQAFPSQVEDTEPDPSPAADTSHVEADEPTTDEGDETGTESGGASDQAGGAAGAAGSETDADGEDGEEVSTEDRYEGERGEDGTVDVDDGADAGDERDDGAEASDERDDADETE